VAYEFFPGNRVQIKATGEYGEVMTVVPGNGSIAWYYVKTEDSEDRFTSNELRSAS
jgi:hypothetical protein